MLSGFRFRNFQIQNTKKMRTGIFNFDRRRAAIEKKTEKIT